MSGEGDFEIMEEDPAVMDVTQGTHHKGEEFVISVAEMEWSFDDIEAVYHALEQGSINKILRTPPILPHGNEVYAYKKKHEDDRDFLCDHYRMKNMGSYNNKGGKFTKTYYNTQVTTGIRCETSKAFRKITYYKIGADTIIIHYLGNHKKGKTNLSHGNSKSKRPFFRSRPSVMEEIKKTLLTKESPLKVYSKVLSKTSAQDNQPYKLVDVRASSTPRNVKQVANALHRENMKRKISRDKVFSVMELAKQDLSEFILEIKLWPNLSVILAHPEAIKLAKKLLMDSKKDPTLEQLMSYDTTFNLGDFYVSIVVMRNTDFEKDPIFPVFFLIHERKDEATHRLFWQHFVNERLELSTYVENTPIVIDREKAIYNAISINPILDGNVVFCLNHILEDINRFLLKNHGNSDDRAVYKQHIVNVCYADNFDEKLNTYLTKWSESFVQYFNKNIRSDLFKKSSKRHFSRFAAFKTKTPTNNISESMNSLVKGHVNNKELPLDSIVLAFYQMQLYFLSEYERGYADLGNYAKKSTSRKSYKINLHNAEFIQVEDIINSVLNKTWKPESEVENKDTYRLTQRAIANKVVRCKLISFEGHNQVWVIKSPFKEIFYTVHTSKSGLVCSCSSRKHCYHVMSVERICGLKGSSKKMYRLNDLRKRTGEGKSGRKKPRPRDVDLSYHIAPDSFEALQTSFFRDINKPSMSINCSIPKKREEKKDQQPNGTGTDPSTSENVNVHDDLEEGRWLEGGTIDKAILYIIGKHKKENQVLYVDNLTFSLFARKSIDSLIKYLHQFDAYNRDAIIVCMNTNVDIGDHWILGVILLNEKKIAIFDSIRDENCRKKEMILLAKITEIAAMIVEIEIQLSKWKFLYNSEDQQNNGFDCGIFVIKNTYKLLSSNENEELEGNMRSWVKSLLNNPLKTQDWNQKKRITSSIIQYIKTNVSKFLNIHVHEARGLLELGRSSLNVYNDQWTICCYNNCVGNPEHSQVQDLCVGCRKWYHKKCVSGKKKGNYFICSKCLKEL